MVQRQSYWPGAPCSRQFSIKTRTLFIKTYVKLTVSGLLFKQFSSVFFLQTSWQCHRKTLNLMMTGLSKICLFNRVRTKHSTLTQYYRLLNTKNTKINIIGLISWKQVKSTTKCKFLVLTSRVNAAKCTCIPVSLGYNKTQKTSFKITIFVTQYAVSQYTC